MVSAGRMMGIESEVIEGRAAATIWVTKAKDVMIRVKMASFNRNSTTRLIKSKSTSIVTAEAALKMRADVNGDLLGAAKYSMCRKAVRKDSPLSQMGKKVEDLCAGRTAATDECTVDIAVKVKKPRSVNANRKPKEKDRLACQGVASLCTSPSSNCLPCVADLIEWV